MKDKEMKTRNWRLTFPLWMVPLLTDLYLCILYIKTQGAFQFSWNTAMLPDLCYCETWSEATVVLIYTQKGVWKKILWTDTNCLLTIAVPDLDLGRDQLREEMPEYSPSFLAYLAFTLLIFTVFYNVLFITVIKPAIDGPEPAADTSVREAPYTPASR